MSARPEVEEREGEARAMAVMDKQREEAGHALMARKQFDLADISKADFAAGLERLQTRQHRMQQILATALIKGAHYGNPNNSLPKPILYQAGAEELRNLFRLQLVQIGEKDVVATSDFTSVTVTVAVQDGAGRILAPRTGSCNTLEKRFRKKAGGWIYEDAREMLHVCHAMAEKRAGVLSTREVTGATAFFATEDEMDKGLTEREAEESGKAAWSPADEESFGRAAKKRGIPVEQHAAFISDALGGRTDVTQADIPALFEALKQYKPGEKPAKKGSEPDLALDQRLAAE